MYSNVITSPDGSSCCVGHKVGVATGVEELAIAPRWSAARTELLVGNCRGSALSRWADCVRRGFGEVAVRRVREAVGELAADIPEEPPEHAWFPVALQIRMTDVVIDEFLGGDATALEPMLHGDIAANLGRVKKAVLRTLGPGPILGRARHLHAHLYDVGTAEATVVQSGATLTSSGAELFSNPTWQLLQLVAQRGLIAFTGRELVAQRASMPGASIFETQLSWH